MNSSNEKKRPTNNRMNQTKLKTRNNEVLLRGFLFSFIIFARYIRSRSTFVWQFFRLHLIWLNFYSQKMSIFCSFLLVGRGKKLVFDCASGAYAIQRTHTNNEIVWTMDFYCDFNSLPTYSIRGCFFKYNNITDYRNNIEKMIERYSFDWINFIRKKRRRDSVNAWQRLHLK